MVQCLEAPVSTASFQAFSQSAVSCVEADRSEAIAQFIAQLDIAALNEQFEQATPQEILTWCINNITQGLVQSTSFSVLAVTHMLYEEMACPVPVIFLDTLHLFPETLTTAQRAEALYGLNLHTYRAVGVQSAEAFAERYGEALWESDINSFYEITKVEPLQRALAELGVHAWITGRRRDQGAERQNLPIFERVEGRLKVNPLANWTRQDLWAYVDEHDVLYNPLHDQGYTSIGDQPLTTPTDAGEDERAGRWRGSEKTECGIHW